jgi:hypothetical protein
MAVVQKLLNTGSPFATELDVRLKSNEPLSSVVDWWIKQYRAWRPTLDAGGVKGVGPISDREWSVFCIFGSEDDLDPDVQKSWGYLRKDRAALQAAVATP